MQVSLVLFGEKEAIPHLKQMVDIRTRGNAYCCLVTKSCPTRGLQHDRLHQLPELAQTHVHQVGDGHPTISTSVSPFSYCLQSFPASGSFPMSQFFTSGGQSIGASVSASVLPMNIQD